MEAFDRRRRGMGIAMSLAWADELAASDAKVLRRMRGGDDAAFAILYERHVGAARRLARSLLRERADVDDVVAEVFAAAFRALQRGKGPADDFRPYVLRSIRRECARTWLRQARRRGPAVDEVDPAVQERHVGPEERAVLQQAFNALPKHFRRVLWLTEVEQLSHAEVAERTGSKAPAVATMAMRARHALAEQYLTAHITPSTPAECGRVRRALAGTVRGTASRREQNWVAAHVARCSECAEVQAQLKLVNSRLRTLAPPALGALTVPRLLGAALQGRLAGWVLAPAAPLTAVTGLVVTGVTLPDASTAAQEPAVVAAPLVIDDAESMDSEALPGSSGAGESPRNWSGAAGDASSDVVSATTQPTGSVAEPATPTIPATGGSGGVVTSSHTAAPDSDTRPAVPDENRTVEVVSAPVADVIEPVADVIEPVADVIEPVADVLAPVTETVAPVVDTVTQPVADVIEPITETVAPVLDPDRDRRTGRGP